MNDPWHQLCWKISTLARWGSPMSLIRTIIAYALVASAAFGLSGCGKKDNVLPSKTLIQSRSINREALKGGMTPQEVEKCLGAPSEAYEDGPILVWVYDLGQDATTKTRKYQALPFRKVNKTRRCGNKLVDMSEGEKNEPLRKNMLGGMMDGKCESAMAMESISPSTQESLLTQIREDSDSWRCKMLESLICSIPVDLETRDERGLTELLRVLDSGELEKAFALIEKGANVNTVSTDQKWTPLGLVLLSKDEKAVSLIKLLIGKGADVNALLDGTPPIVGAIWSENATVVKMLIDAGADINRKFQLGKREGFTPLIVAARSGSKEFAKMLLEAGADVSAEDSCGMTACGHALALNRQDVADLLLDKMVTATATRETLLQTESNKATQYLQRIRQEDAQDRKKPISITAKALFNQYEENELQADKQFKGRLLAVTGTVDSVRVRSGKVTVCLKSCVRCEFADARRPEFAELQQGDLVTITGICKGSMIGVEIVNCTEITKNQ